MIVDLLATRHDEDENLARHMADQAAADPLPLEACRWDELTRQPDVLNFNLVGQFRRWDGADKHLNTYAEGDEVDILLDDKIVVRTHVIAVDNQPDRDDEPTTFLWVRGIKHTIPVWRARPPGSWSTPESAG